MTNVECHYQSAAKDAFIMMPGFTIMQIRIVGFAQLRRRRDALQLHHIDRRAENLAYRGQKMIVVSEK